MGNTKESHPIPPAPMTFSATVREVFAAGRALWRNYHAQPNAHPNASSYDIREHFLGRNARGAMNPERNDGQYSAPSAALRRAE